EFAGAVDRTASKLEHACQLAAALGYLVVREGDEVGLSLADTALHEHLPPGAGFSHLLRTLDALGRARPEGRTDLGACLDQVYQRAKRRGVLVVLSDFLDPGGNFWNSIDLFRRSRFDVMLFHLAHPEELDLPAVAAARFTDPEAPGHFNTEPDAVRVEYRRRFDAFLNAMKGHCQPRRCDWYLSH